MVLTVDIGNSNIVVGVWNNKSLKFTGRFQTRRDYSEKELTESFMELLDFDKNNACVHDSTFEGAILSSVVPEITDNTLHALENITGKRPLLMGPFLHTGVDTSDYAPGAIGMDRIVDLSAALAMYGAPVMVCDLGTCTTITVAGPIGNSISCDIHESQRESEKAVPSIGKLTGGMICPGVQLSLDAEAKRASQLPQLTADNVSTLLGKDTASNMMAGAVAGTGLMLSELADRIFYGEFFSDVSDGASVNSHLGNEPELYQNLKVVITGGLGRYVKPWIKCRAQVHYEQNLLLRGLYEIYTRNK